MNYCKFCNKEINDKHKFCSVACNINNINKNKPIWKFNIDSEKHQVLEGCLISDGYLEICKGINTIPCFGIGQMESKLEYLEFLKEKLSLNVKIGKCKHFHKKTGKIHYSYRFRTLRCKELLEYYRRWYPSGKKIIPKDFEITPISLYHWFIGDGSFYNDKGETKIMLYTNGFLKEDVAWVKSKLAKFNLNFNIYLQKYKGYDKLYPILQMSNKIDVAKFFNFLPKNTVSCFKYKFDTKL